jgi:hypothetical protein
VSGFLLSPRSNKSWSYLPDRGITSKNGHNITFNDGIDGSTFYWSLAPALKLVKSYIPNCLFPPVLKDDMNHRSLTGGMTLSDRYGMYRINMSSDTRSVAIESPMGNVTLSAFTGITISAPNGDVKIVGKNVSIEAGDTVTIESGQNVKERFFSDDDCYSEEGLDWKQRWGKTKKDMWTNLCRGLANRTINKVIDVPLIRTVLDVALRPIDGTTKIKSYTFVRMEAGKGSAEYPRTALKDTAGELAAYDLVPSIKKIAEIVGSRVDAIKLAYNTVCEKVEEFNGISGENGYNPQEAVISVDNIKNAGANLTFKWDRIKLDDIKSADDLDKEFNDAKSKLGAKPKSTASQYKGEQGKKQYELDKAAWSENMLEINRKRQAGLKKMTEDLTERKNVIKNKANNLKDAIQAFTLSVTNFHSEGENYTQVFGNEIKAALRTLEFDKINTTDVKKDMAKKDDVEWQNWRTHYMRLAVYNLLTSKDVKDKVCAGVKLKSSTKTTENLNTNDNWTTLVNDFVNEPDEGAGSKSVWAEKYKDPIWDPFVNRKRWRVGLQGKILLSDSSDNTLIFDRNGEVKSRENSMFTKKTPDKLKDLLKNVGA